MELELGLNRHLKLNGFVLKLIALITMTIDHVAAIYAMFNGLDNNAIYVAYTVCRIIGRLAFPLFIYLMVEGMVKTKHQEKYLLRLGIAGIILLGAAIFVYYYLGSNFSITSPFNDLFFNALIVYLLTKKKPWIKSLAILPIAFSIICFAVNVYEYQNYTSNLSVAWLPTYVRMDYNLIGTILTLLFFYLRPLALSRLKKNAVYANSSDEEIMSTLSFQSTYNILSATALVLFNFVLYIVSIAGIYDYYIQTYCLFSALFILFYNGQRGYNATWFKYGSYLYYALHMIIIYLIFCLIYL